MGGRATAGQIGWPRRGRTPTTRPAAGAGASCEGASLESCGLQRGRWIKTVGRESRRLPVEDVLLAPTALDALLKLLVEFFVELDRVRIDARADHLDRLLEVGHRHALRVLGLPEGDHGGLSA